MFRVPNQLKQSGIKFREVYLCIGVILPTMGAVVHFCLYNAPPPRTSNNALYIAYSTVFQINSNSLVPIGSLFR